MSSNSYEITPNAEYRSYGLVMPQDTVIEGKYGNPVIRTTRTLRQIIRDIRGTGALQRYSILESNNQYLLYTFNEEGKQICGAKNKNEDSVHEYCHTYPIRGRNRCKKHGGGSLIGAEHPRFQDGRYSKELPTRLGDLYAEALRDEEALTLTHEIALTDVRIRDMLKRVDSGESGETWRQIQQQFKALRKAARRNDTQKFSQHMNEMEELIEKGYGDYQAWSEISHQITSRRKLVESENKRRQTASQTMTAERAMAMISYITSVVKEHVRINTDKEVGDKILTGINKDVSEFLARKR